MVHALYQIFVMCVLMFFGVFIFFNGEDQKGAFNLIADPERADDRKTLDTICFHSFILMNLFNMINCRVLDTIEHTEMNVFKTLCKFKSTIPPMPEHAIFWMIMAAEIFIQQMSITKLAWVFQTAQLSRNLQIVCWSIGASSLIVNIVVKKVDFMAFGFMNDINLEKVVEDEFINWFMGWFDSSVSKLSSAITGNESELDQNLQRAFMALATDNVPPLVSKGDLEKLLHQAFELNGKEKTNEEIKMII